MSLFDTYVQKYVCAYVWHFQSICDCCVVICCSSTIAADSTDSTDFVVISDTDGSYDSDICCS